MLAKTKMMFRPSQECPQVDVNYEANSLLMIDCPEFSSHAKVKRMPFLGCGNVKTVSSLAPPSLSVILLTRGSLYRRDASRGVFPLDEGSPL